MANKTKKPLVDAPVVEDPKENNAAPTKVDVVQMGDLDKIKQGYAKNGGLDPNHRVDVLMGIKTYFKDDPNAAKNTGVPQEAVDKINGIAAIGFVAALGDEIMMGQSGWAAKMRMTQIEAINSVNTITGISIDVKALPAPDKDGNVEVKEENVKISKETKSKLKEEKKANEEAASNKKEYLIDHTKIETDDQLKEALAFQLVNSKITSPLDRLITTAQFYRSYLESRAETAKDPQAELAKIHEFTLADLLQDISTMVPPSFTAEGFGKLLCKRIEDVQSVVPAFELLKRCGRNRKTGVFKFSDEEIAALVRVLVVWKASAKIASLSNDLKTLSKDAKKNAKAIEQVNTDIAAEQNLMTLVTEPSFELADNFIAAYKDENHALHKQATEVAKSISETYYKDTEITELEFDSLLLNIQQHVGIILNLFTSEVGRRDDYSADNLISFDAAPEGDADDKGEGEGGKNS